MSSFFHPCLSVVEEGKAGLVAALFPTDSFVVVGRVALSRVSIGPPAKMNCTAGLADETAAGLADDAAGVAAGALFVRVVGAGSSPPGFS